MIMGCGKSADPVITEPDAFEFTGTPYALQWGPVMVPGSQDPGREGTKCIDIRLGNETEIKVHQLHNTLFTGSHHLIVYKNDLDTEERLAPYDCNPFAGALNASGMVAPMMITQRADDPLTLPDGVGYTLAPHQMIRLEMHYFNTNEAAIEAMSRVEFWAAEPSTVTQEANLLFIGSPDIDIQPNETKSVHGFFTPERASLDLTGAKFFAITGHTHKLGLDVTVKVGTKTASEPVYSPDSFQWAEPETTSFRPGFEVPVAVDTTNAKQTGFDFTCDYRNTTSKTVGFGESAEDEMCFFWAYYYPSKGAFVCMRSEAYGIDLCCPSSDTSLQAICNMIIN